MKENNQQLRPTSQSERISSLDFLRGFALLGILVVNVQGMAMISATYQNPVSFGNLDGVNYWVWWVTHVFFEMKMMALFSMLFGAGMVLMAEKAEQNMKPFIGLHYRRMGWLMLFGLAHAYLIWYGDILFCYSICGMILIWARKWKPIWLIFSGLVLLSVPALLTLLFSWAFQHMSEQDLAVIAADWRPSAEKAQKEIEIYRGSWFEQFEHRAPTAFMMETFINLIIFFWRAGGLMLWGMAFYKLGIVSGKRSAAYYLASFIISATIGFTLVAYGVNRNFAEDWTVVYSMTIGTQFNYWGSLFVAFGYIGLTMLLCKFNGLGWLRRSLEAVGQMAFTNYLTQSILCTFVFYGHGLGWIGYLDRSQQVGIVLGVWIFQLIISPIWLKYYRFGPFEWLWRSLAYWHRQPFRRRPIATDQFPPQRVDA